MQRPAFGFKPGITDMMYRDPRQPVPGLLGSSPPASPPELGGEAPAFDPNMIGGTPNAHGPAFNKLPPGTPGGMPIDLPQPQNLPAFQQQGNPTNYPGIERPMPPMGGSVGAGMRPPGAGPIGGNMMPGGVRPGTYGRPNPMPRDPRGRMRGM